MKLIIQIPSGKTRRSCPQTLAALPPEVAS
jgi:hypothetical protein